MPDEISPPASVPPTEPGAGGNGDRYEPLNIEDELKDSYLTYAMSVIISRALPDVRDGLKPSQRRILLAMNDLNLGPTGATSKCAGIVGEKYQLANTGAGDVNLTERDLYKPGVMAVSLERASLRPGESTNLFVIRERRAND